MNYPTSPVPTPSMCGTCFDEVPCTWTSAERLHQELLKHDILHSDKSTVLVLHEDGRPAETQSYMWCYRTGRDGLPIVLFDYKTTRAGKHPKKFLSRFRGYLHTDEYSGYDQLPDVTLVGAGLMRDGSSMRH